MGLIHDWDQAREITTILLKTYGRVSWYRF